MLSLLCKYFLELFYFICCIKSTIKIVVVDVGLHEMLAWEYGTFGGKKYKVIVIEEYSDAVKSRYI